MGIPICYADEFEIKHYGVIHSIFHLVKEVNNVA